jgi:hypothetical protein
MKIVKLTQDIPPNANGETCGFPDTIADRYVNEGRAVLVRGSKPAAPVVAAPEPAVDDDQSGWQGGAEEDGAPAPAAVAPPAPLPDSWLKGAPKAPPKK